MGQAGAWWSRGQGGSPRRGTAVLSRCVAGPQELTRLHSLCAQCPFSTAPHPPGGCPALHHYNVPGAPPAVPAHGQPSLHPTHPPKQLPVQPRPQWTQHPTSTLPFPTQPQLLPPPHPLNPTPPHLSAFPSTRPPWARAPPHAASASSHPIKPPPPSAVPSLCQGTLSTVVKVPFPLRPIQ